MRKLPFTLLLALLPSLADAAPLQISGWVLDPPRGVQVELRPYADGYQEALERLRGEAVPPLASVRPRPDGSFAIQVPDTGFYSVVVRAPGHLALEHFVPFVVEDTEVPPVELPPASPLEIRAVGADGRPLAGVTIQAIPQQSEGDWRAAERRGVTDAEGKAVFLRAERESLSLFITTPGLYGTASTSPSGSPQTVRFPAPRSRTVEFRGPGGRPAAGALVRLAPRGWPFGLTGEDGRIALPVPEKNEIGLFAEDSKGLRIEVVMTPEAGEGTDVPVVALRSPTTVTGKVLDAATREPLSGALVWSGGTAWTRAGAGGTFELRAPSGDQGQVEASAPGRLRHVHGWTREKNEPITFSLGLAAAASGRVVDEEGLPVAGAEVSLRPVEERIGPLAERAPFLARSDAEGRFRIAHVSAGPFLLQASRAGFAPESVSGILIPERKAEIDLGTVTLHPGGAIEGIVTDTGGRPVEGARVDLSPFWQDGFAMADWFQRTPAESGPDGRFRIADLPRGRRFTLTVQHRALTSAEVLGVEVPTVQPLRVQLDRPRSLEGRVIDKEGEPVAEAWVSQHEMIRGGVAGTGFSRGHGGRSAASDAEGRFVLSGLKPGTIELSVSAFGYRSRQMPGIEVPEEGEPAPVEIVLEAGTAVEGRVLDGEGDPVPGANVQALQRHNGSVNFQMVTATDEEGRYEFGDIEPGRYEFGVNLGAMSAALLPVEVRPGRSRLDLRLPTGVEVAGRVADGQGSPLAGASVSLVRLGLEDPFQGFGQEPQAVSAADGSFVLRNVPDGEYRLAAGRRGFAASTVELRVAGVPVNGLELRLDPGAVIRGRLLGLEPGESRRAMISAFSPENEAQLQGVVGPDGSYRIEGVAPGEWHVIAHLSPQVVTERRVQASPGEKEIVLDLEIPAGFTLTGRVLLDRSPLPGAEVVVHGANPEGPAGGQRTTAHDGSFRMERLPAGSYTLLVVLSTGMGHAQTLEIGGDRDVLIEIATGAVEGRLLSPEGLPVAGAAVSLSGEDAELQTRFQGPATRSDDLGLFALPRVAAGTYKVIVQAEGFAPAESRVVVTPGGTVHVEIALIPDGASTPSVLSIPSPPER